MTATLGNPTLDRLADEASTIRTRLQGVLDDAAEGERDLSEDETVRVRAWREDLERIDAQVDLIGGALAIDQQAAQRLAALPGTRQAARGGDVVQYRSGGELLYDMLHQVEPERRERYREVLTRAAQHMGTDSTSTTATAGDLGGLHVAPVVGTVFRPDPFLAALTFGVGAVQGPAAFTFERPYLVDGTSPTAPDVQATEKAEVASRKFDVESDTLKYETLAQYLNVSQQLLSWQPGSLAVILTQMRRRQARALDAKVLAGFSSTTTTIDLESDGDAAAVQAAIAAAALSVLTDTGSPAEWVAVGPEAYYRLIGLTDAAGRPLFPVTGPSNVPGTTGAGGAILSVQGLRVIMTTAIADGAMYVGNGVAFEVYLADLPVLEAVEPSVLGRQIALGVGVATYTPTDLANAVAKIADPTP